MKITCPYNCGVTYVADRRPGYLADGNNETADGRVSFEMSVCPNCERPVIDVRFIDGSSDLKPYMLPQSDAVRVWPRSGRVAPPEVPDEISVDYNEAALVLSLSPKASAALARRCLQHVLVDHLSAKGPNLNAQIKSVDVPSRDPARFFAGGDLKAVLV